jgi:sugar/nucleoside kinase (ribokinase family)
MAERSHNPGPDAQPVLEENPPAILVLGDMLLDVVVTGDLQAAREAQGAVQLYAGGSAANFAVGAARAGAAVRFVGRVGDDLAGRLLVDELARAGVNPAVQITPGVPPGTVLVLADVDGHGGNRMLSEVGASGTLTPADLDPAWFAGLAGLHLTGYSFLRPGPAPAARHALALARSAAGGIVCSMDPAPAPLIRAFGPHRFRAQLADLRFDVLFPNLEEGQVITGETEPQAVLAALCALAPLVALKLGPAGCLVAWNPDRTDLIHLPPSAIRHPPSAIPARPGPVVDTTGAGDAFAAGFMVAYLRRRDPVRAAQAAVEAAAAIVSRVGPR